MATSITSVNAIFTLTIPGVFSTPVQIQQFAMDDVFTTDPIDAAEVQMGVDGHMSAGYVFVPTKTHVVLSADSPSLQVFDQWRQVQKTQRDMIFADGTLEIDSVGTYWQMTGGALTSYAPMPDVGKVLKPRKFEITWEDISNFGT